MEVRSIGLVLLIATAFPSSLHAGQEARTIS
jgi:hypothetical protein